MRRYKRYKDRLISLVLVYKTHSWKKVEFSPASKVKKIV